MCFFSHYCNLFNSGFHGEKQHDPWCSREIPKNLRIKHKCTFITLHKSTFVNLQYTFFFVFIYIISGFISIVQSLSCCNSLLMGWSSLSLFMEAFFLLPMKKVNGRNRVCLLIVHFWSVVIGRSVVFWGKWIALCSKSDFYPFWEGGDVLPAGPGAALKGEDLQTLQSDMFLCKEEVTNDQSKQDACEYWVMFL